MARTPVSSEAALIVRTLKHMTNVQHRRVADICADYERWCLDNDRGVEVGDESVRKWSAGETVPTRFGNFYDFALTQSQTPDPKSHVGKLVHAANQLFPSGNANAGATLARLAGEYDMIRRLWTPIGSDDCIRCKAWFTVEDSVVVYREEESFLSDYQVEEAYEGYAFMFGSSFWILAQEKELKSLKFLTIHECAPTVTATGGLFDLCKGNLIAVSGRGPNVSHRFVLRRKRSQASYGIVKKNVAMSLFDKTTLDYLYE